MAKPLDDAEVEEIIEAYQEHGTKKAAHEETGRSLSTVSKYIDEWEEEQESADPDTDIDPAPPGYTAPPPSGSDPAEDPVDSDNFASMSEEDFILWFFDHKGHGVKSNFADNLATHCELRQEIPDKAEMANRLMKQNSGIGNDADVDMIAENYWAAAQRWLQAKGRQHPSMGGQEEGYVGPGGQWVSNGGGQGGGSQQGGPAGGWVSSNPSAGGQPAQPTRGGGRGRQQPQRHPQQPPRGQPQGPPPGDQRTDKLEEAINDLKQTQVAILQQLGNDDKSEEVRTIKEQVNEMAEMQETLEKISGGNDDGSEDIERIQAELAEMRQDLQRAEMEDGGIQVSGDNGFAAIAQLAGRDDMDPETLGVLADAMGVTDPEVKKAEFDLKKTERKLENRKELVDNVIEGLGEVSGSALATAMDSLTGGDDDDEGADEQQGGGHGAGAVEAGEPTATSGEIQVVDAGGDEEPIESPARQRFNDFRSPGGDESEPESGSAPGGGFRSAGGPDEGDGGSCQWIHDDGEACPLDAVAGEAFCEDHLAAADDEGW